ncbi:type I-C CRISPR-associated protein Cas7/Csd2 [Chamaesiphon minutus]|uniref:CRISPR-associated protein Cas7/Csd2, subtype I-C/DVULG n=1 Tax=Chamaesiphon minutus (strain ATCC 27169 / PCC 6605) TaxID=1173020 RepID=K9UFC4_CHAP6|nr:type I-C CRISPR-associated protein Cas7/Csd2 [Chamaesiphon minutus]AFY93136.1 CRISPR-associated protein Cas7/Csd2, subtype I-C/DVULG [Chamaesiphon minutus PCC 6605]
MTVHLDCQRRHDFVLLFDVTDGNPNGDPDGGNMPRTDAETSHGLVTDVCLKRKIRNYVSTYAEYEATEEQAKHLNIFVEHHGVLNNQIRRAYTEQGIPTGKPASEVIKENNVLETLREYKHLLPAAFTFTDSEGDTEEDVIATLAYSGELTDAELKEELEKTEEIYQNKAVKKFIDALVKKAGKPDKSRANAEKARKWMCENFYDVRMFGAVMSTGLNAGQVRGPVQLTFARSFDPVLPQDLAVTRVAVTDVKDAEKLQTIGRKTLIPYGLYMMRGFYSPSLAAQTGVNDRDLELFWESLVKMWDFDRSASRGLMAPRGLYVFSHESKLGNAPAHKLFDRITAQLDNPSEPPRKFGDYQVSIDDAELPSGVTLTRLTEG